PYGTAPDAEGPDWVVGSWSGNYRGVVIPDDLVYTAAADHCLGAAYRGECPGVDPDALMHWRVAQRATFQGRDAGPEGYLWQEESAVPHGEWYSVHPYLERRDALCTYRHIITSER